MARYINTEGARIYVSDFVCEQMKKIPTADVVSVDACKQISKERDFAIKQLHSYGVQFGEKADVVKVKHGEWKKKTDDIFYWYECSECSEPIPYNKYKNMYFSDYCPNCGAKMDKESDT